MAEQTIEEMAALAAVEDTLEEQENPKSPTTPISDDEQEAKPEISSDEQEEDTSDDSSEEEVKEKQPEEPQEKQKKRKEEPRSDKGGKAPKDNHEKSTKHKSKKHRKSNEDVPDNGPKILAFFGPDFLVHPKNFRARRYYMRLEDGTKEWQMSYSWEKEEANCVNDFWSQESVMHWVPAKGSNKTTRGTMDSYKFNTTTHQDGPFLQRLPNPHFTPKGGKKPSTAIIPLQVGASSQVVTPEASLDLVDFRQKFQDSMTQIETSLSTKLSSLLEPVMVKVDLQSNLLDQITSKISALTESHLQTQIQSEQFQTNSNAFFTNMQGYFSQCHQFSMSVQQFVAESDKRTSDSFEKSNVLMQSLTSNMETLVKHDFVKSNFLSS